jgi:hypothetical protein
MIRSRPFGNAAGSAARIALSRRSEQLALVLLEIELSQERIKNETPKKARGDRRQEWRFHCENFAHRDQLISAKPRGIAASQRIGLALPARVVGVDRERNVEKCQL